MIFDIIVITILVTAMVFGFRSGFIYTFIHTTSWFLAVLISFIWSSQARDFITLHTGIYDSLYNVFLGKFSESFTAADETLAQLPEIIAKVIRSTETNFISTLADTMTSLSVTVISFLLVLLTVKIMLWIITELLSKKKNKGFTGALDGILGLAFGIVQGFLVTYMGIQPFIVTLAGMFFGRGMTAIISTDMISIKNEVFLKWANYRFYMPFGSTNKKGKFIPAYIPPTVVIAIIVVLIIAVLLKYFKFGRKLYAIGGNRQSALMMGLDVKKTMFRAYVLDGFLAGLGGFLFCLNSCAGFVEQAKGLEMDAISSAVIGGTLLSGGVGTPIGSLFGVLIKGTISSLITTQGTLSSWWVRIILSALLCFFIVIQSVIASMKKKNK